MIFTRNAHYCTLASLMVVAIMLLSSLPSLAQITISGNVSREDGMPVENVPVFITGSMDTMAVTQANGSYSVSVPAGSYQVNPVSNAAPQNGVTTLDAYLIKRHYEGVEALGSPYKLIAADMDLSEVLDTMDLVELGNTIYGISQYFTYVNSWRFVPADYVFPDPANPWFETVPEVVQLTGLNTDVQQDFVAIKMGDVNYTATTQLEVDPCALGCGSVSGYIAADTSGNCIVDAGERPLEGWIVQVTDGETTYYANTNSEGYYSLVLPTGNYVVTVHSPYENLWQSCNDNVAIALTENEDYTLDIAMEALVDCPLLEVDLSTAFLRRCFSAHYYVTYCNQGTALAEDAYIELSLDEYINLVVSSEPWTQQVGNTFTFPIGDLEAGECGVIYLWVDVSCESVLGETLCSEATIYPDNLCGETDEAWDGSSLDVNTYCDGDSVRFEIRNLGDDMDQAVEFIVIEDDMIMMLENNEVQLGSGETAQYAFPASGATWRLEAAQPFAHPYTDRISKTIEGCEADGDRVFSLGFVTQFPQYTHHPWETELCVENIGSYDPNDKRAWPVGAKAAHFVEPGTSLDYQIRFQNTGTDTAFLVEIQDTLSSWLDPASLQLLSASHPYDYKVSEEGILSVYFHDIMLPDSNVNEAASHGYVKFRIDQAAEVPLGTVINNEAAIYFDFNEPVITNETHHTVAIDFLDVINYVVAPEAPAHQLRIAPNPITNDARIRLQDLSIQSGEATLYDLSGRVMRKLAFSGSELELSAEGLAPGMYLLEIWDGPQRLGVAKVAVQ